MRYTKYPQQKSSASPMWDWVAFIAAVLMLLCGDHQLTTWNLFLGVMALGAGISISVKSTINP